MYFYKCKIEEGAFVGVNYSDIVEGIAYERHVLEGHGFICTANEYPTLETITEEQFNAERMAA